MMNQIKLMGCLLAACCALGGCASDCCKLGTADPASGNQGLSATLKVDSPRLWANAMPGILDEGQCRRLNLTLTVTNQGAGAYVGATNTDTQIERFWLADGDVTVWQSCSDERTKIKCIKIDAGQTICYVARCEVDDLRQYRGRTLTAYAEFMPQHVRVKVDVPVTDAL